MTEYVEANTNDGAGWWFYIESDAEDSEEQAGEVIRRLDGLFEAFGDFIIPTEVTIGYRLLSENLPLSACFTGLGEDPPGTSHSKTFKSDNGVGKLKLQQAIQELRKKPLYVPNLRIKQNKVKIEFASGTQYVDCSHPQYRYPETNKASGQDPLWEPIKPKNLAFGDNEFGVKHGYPFSYWLPVNVYSNIWFEDSELGQCNRENLLEFLEDIETHLPVITVRRERGGCSVEQLKSIY